MLQLLVLMIRSEQPDAERHEQNREREPDEAHEESAILFFVLLLL